MQSPIERLFYMDVGHRLIFQFPVSTVGSNARGSGAETGRPNIDPGDRGVCVWALPTGGLAWPDSTLNAVWLNCWDVRLYVVLVLFFSSFTMVDWPEEGWCGRYRWIEWFEIYITVEYLDVCLLFKSKRKKFYWLSIWRWCVCVCVCVEVMSVFL